MSSDTVFQLLLTFLGLLALWLRFTIRDRNRERNLKLDRKQAENNAKQEQEKLRADQEKLYEDYKRFFFEQTEKLTSQIDQAHKDRLEDANRISTLERQRGELESKSAELTSQLTTLKANSELEAKTRQAERDRFLGRIETLERDLTIKSETQAQAYSKLETVLKERDETIKQRDDAIHKLEATIIERDRVIREYEQAKQDRTTLESEMTDLKQTLSQRDDRIMSLERRVKELEEKETARHQEIDRFQAEELERGARLKEAQTAVESGQKALIAANQIITQQQETISRLTNPVAAEAKTASP